MPLLSTLFSSKTLFQLHLLLQVHLAEDCVGPAVSQQLQSVPFGEVLLLENTRFHPEEEKNDPDFARQVGSRQCRR